jgi:hypothetical protein
MDAVQDHEHAVWLCWGLLTLTAASLKNPCHLQLYPTEAALQAAMTSITFAPRFMKALRSTTAPSIALFKRLPLNTKGSRLIWAVYVIVLEKRNHRSKIYIGSGTDSRHGVKVRLQHYKPKSKTLPKLVKKAVDVGYPITYKGLLCWTDLPAPKKRFSCCSLFLILECVFIRERSEEAYRRPEASAQGG